MTKSGKWRMPAPCENCPLNASGPGLALRRSLRKSHWAGVLQALLRSRHFLCHKTTEETGDGSNPICAGSIAWQERHGVSSNLQRVMERIDQLFGSRGHAHSSQRPMPEGRKTETLEGI